MADYPPARRTIVIAGWVWAVVLVAGSTNAFLDLLLFGILALATLVIAPSWMGYTFAWAVAFRPSESRSSLRQIAAWLSAPAVAISAVALADTGTPMAVRLWLGEGEMRSYA